VGGVEWRYVYDPENRLTEAWRGVERVAAFRYDADGTRAVREVGGAARWPWTTAMRSGAEGCGRSTA